MKKYVAALDQGTTSSRAVLFDREQNIAAIAQKELAPIYPQPGYVEQDPMEIYATQYSVLTEALAKSGIRPEEIAAVGITNQRETTILWDRETGRPVFNAIVWQCRRTAPLCEELKEKGWAEPIREKTGLVLDAYFSATKIAWVLDHVPGVRERAEKGNILFGTVDTWLVWKLTEGRVHVTDPTNASRTMLYDIRKMCWDQELLELLNIPGAILPEVRPSSEVYGTFNLSGTEIPIAGIAGDQQAALFGQACFSQGEAKNTYGTGCFLLMNTGEKPCFSKHGLVSTLAAHTGGTPRYALEGSVFMGGAVVQWLRDELHFVDEAADTEYFARKVPDSGGVYVVPAFTGMGAPHWDMYARGAIFGLTRGTGRNHIIRAALESIAYQSAELLQAVEADTGIAVQNLRADGGASSNEFLMQFQADILGTEVVTSPVRETTALGAAYLAGLAVGFWNSQEELREHWTPGRAYSPHMEKAERTRLFQGWEKAVKRSMGWDEKQSLSR